MNGSAASARDLARGVAARADGIGADVAVCPAYVHLPEVAAIVAGTPVALGAQNVSEYAAGAFTGEVSGAMLRELGCTYAIVGHSERRHIFGESDADVAAKFEAARTCGLTPILCVGEQLAQRDAGETEAVISAQLDAVIARCGVAALANAVIAYEPVWAIGTGKTASPEQAQSVHAFIRQRISATGAEDVAAGVRILYGGSVKATNAAALFGMPDIDGGLIGGASLDADEFHAICAAAP